MTRFAPALLFVGVALGGCGQEPVASGGAQLLLPEEVEFHWNDAYNGDGDALAALVPFDVMVYDGESGEPIGWAAVEVSGEHAKLVAAEWVQEAWVQDCGDCRRLWDVWRDDHVDLVAEPESTLTLSTDADGLVRVYAIVDSLPTDDEGFLPARVTVAADSLEATLLLVTD